VGPGGGRGWQQWAAQRGAGRQHRDQRTVGWLTSALSYYDSMRAPRINAALTQGLRDFFGAHTYLRTDSDGTFHPLWSGDPSEIRAG
jgi:6-phosphogluconate dehydrogenase